jgi:hypothetical protein
MFLATAGGDYGYLAYRLGHHLPLAPAGLALAAFWGQSLVLFGVAVVLFPDGRLPTRFWRVTLRIYCAIVAVLISRPARLSSVLWPPTRSASTPPRA